MMNFSVFLVRNSEPATRRSTSNTRNPPQDAIVSCLLWTPIPTTYPSSEWQQCWNWSSWQQGSTQIAAYCCQSENPSNSTRSSDSRQECVDTPMTSSSRWTWDWLPYCLCCWSGRYREASCHWSSWMTEIDQTVEYTSGIWIFSERIAWPHQFIFSKCLCSS